MLDWIFEGIVTWISSVVSDMMDAVSGLFLQCHPMHQFDIFLLSNPLMP